MDRLCDASRTYPLLAEHSAAVPARIQLSFGTTMIIAAAALIASFFIRVAHQFTLEWTPLSAAVPAAGADILLSFGLSLLPANALSTRLLPNQRGGLVLVTSACCLVLTIGALGFSLLFR